MANAADFDQVFKDLVDIIHSQREIIHELTEYLLQIKSIGGGGSGNGFQVYESGKEYKRYQALIDPNTDIAYLVVPHEGDTYISESVQTDCENGNLLIDFLKMLWSLNTILRTRLIREFLLQTMMIDILLIIYI